eukprot:XP_016659724.1 PREDICTED: zinc finger MYM-type protein 1-like [Acyrthosiphon pisum]
MKLLISAQKNKWLYVFVMLMIVFVYMRVFLKFITVNSLIGCNVAESIINGLISCGINCDFLFGQGYDGASNMSGQYKGVQSIIKEQFTHAIYVHCAAHSLNLAISTASEIQSIRNCLGIIEKF